MRFHLTLGLVVLAGCGLACGSGGGGADGGSGTGSGGSSGGSTGGCHAGRCGSSGGTGAAGTSPLGGACTQDGDCVGGLACITAIPGGYCSAACSPNQPCGASGATCVEPLPGQFACGLDCQTDADCSRPGFSCDPTCRVCVPSYAVGQVSCAPNYAGGGGRLADGGVCGAVPDAGALAWSSAVEVSGSDATQSEAEGSAAVFDGGVVVGFMVSFGDGGGQNRIGVAASADGTTFSAPTLVTDGLDQVVFDPSVAVGATGRFYYAFGALGQTGGQTSGAVYLMSSSDGQSWSTPAALTSSADFNVVQGDGPGSGVDKPFMVVNPATEAPNTIFCSFVGPYDSPTVPSSYGIHLVAGRSASSGTDVELDVGQRAALRDLPSLAFDGLGNAYATWAESTDVDAIAEDQITGTEIAGSTKAGIWFATAPLFGRVPAQPAANVQVSAATDSVVFDVPRVAVSSDGTDVYVVYVVGGVNATDIALAKSRNGGTSFAAPVIVNGDPGCATHFHPAVAVDGAGGVWVSWVDNRDGNGRVYYTSSTDGAKTFAPAAPVTADPFYFTTLSPNTFAPSVPAWLGGYQSLVVSGSDVYSLWSGAVGGASPQSPAHVYLQKATLP